MNLSTERSIAAYSLCPAAPRAVSQRRRSASPSQLASSLTGRFS